MRVFKNYPTVLLNKIKKTRETNMKTSFQNLKKTLLISAGCALSFAQNASATTGFLTHCTGYHCGTGGAGVALPTDASNSELNPALIAELDTEITVAPGLFHPVRKMNSSAAPVGNPAGEQRSKLENFLDGSAGFTYRVNDKWVLGISASGNGGMVTKYPSPRSNPALQTPGPNRFDSEIFYRLALVSPTISHALTKHVSLGLSLVLGYSDFKSNSAQPVLGGLFMETSGGLQRETAYGFGVRGGVLWKANDMFSFGLAFSSPVYFEQFQNYRDILTGPLNRPLTGTIGATWHAMKDLNFVLDYNFIYYGGFEVLAKPPAEGGFGWESMHVFKGGVQYTFDPDWTVRLGVAYGQSPIPDDHVFANVLAPGVVEWHLTAGLTFRPLEDWETTLSGFYAPNNKQTDPGTGDIFSALGKGTTIEMYQYGIQFAVKKKF